jgi:predicted membrane-bound dolichyl-phosphate-mannose-protein mannosyltransferase
LISITYKKYSDTHEKFLFQKKITHHGKKFQGAKKSFLGKNNKNKLSRHYLTAHFYQNKTFFSKGICKDREMKTIMVNKQILCIQKMFLFTRNLGLCKIENYTYDIEINSIWDIVHQNWTSIWENVTQFDISNKSIKSVEISELIGSKEKVSTIIA